MCVCAFLPHNHSLVYCTYSTCTHKRMECKCMQLKNVGKAKGKLHSSYF